MMALNRKKIVLTVLLAAVVAGMVGIFVAFGPPALYSRSESPEFCAGCHVMASQYEAWFLAGGHRRLKCVDCHLPNDTFPRHLVWKGIDGMKDAVSFHAGRFPETIRLSDRGARVVQDNCQQCHEATMARVAEERRCWECHRRLSHQLAGLPETLNQTKELLLADTTKNENISRKDAKTQRR